MSQFESRPRGTVCGLAVKVAHDQPMELRDEIEAIASGVRGAVRASERRAITLLSEERWAEACAELGEELPWHLRRANVLVRGLDLSSLIGRRVRIGDALVQVEGETHPCNQMDAARAGLRAALETDCRGGVHGSIVHGGAIAVSDPVEPVAE